MDLADEQRRRRWLLVAAMVVAASGCSGPQQATQAVTEVATRSTTAVVTATPTSSATAAGDDADHASGTSPDELAAAGPSPTAAGGSPTGIPVASACGVVDRDEVAEILGSSPASSHDIAIGDELPPEFGLPAGQTSTGFHCAFRGDAVEDEVRRVPALTVSIYPATAGEMSERLERARADGCRVATGSAIDADAVVITCGHPTPPSASEVTHMAVLGDALFLCGATVLQQHAMSLNEDMASFCLAIVEDLTA